MIFSQFGKIKKCEIVRDWKTGDSLQYAFITFETARACEEAYLKMQNCLVDNHRIKVDFSQSTSKSLNKLSKTRERKKELYRDIIKNEQDKLSQNRNPYNVKRHKRIDKLH